MIFKNVWIYSKREKKIRMFRITGGKRKHQITFGLQPKLLSWEKKLGSLKI